MPQLPTFEVTNAQAQRLLAAFGSQEEYLAWLRARLIIEVKTREAEKAVNFLDE